MIARSSKRRSNRTERSPTPAAARSSRSKKGIRHTTDGESECSPGTRASRPPVTRELRARRPRSQVNAVTIQPPAPTTAERARLTGLPHELARWRKWGPYVADRAWGTVREDYSANGDAWSYFPHDLARSKAFRWGEDGIAG